MSNHSYHQSNNVSCTWRPCAAASETNCESRDVYVVDGWGYPKTNGSMIARTVFAFSDATRARSASTRSGRQSVHIFVQPASDRK